MVNQPRSSMSYMNLQITHHWNDAIVTPKPISRDSISSVFQPGETANLSEIVDNTMSAPSNLAPSQHESHCTRVRQHLNIAELSQNQRDDLCLALCQPTTSQKRKALVEFIRNNDTVIRWAASLRCICESLISP